jgi:TolA-binding protein
MKNKILSNIVIGVVLGLFCFNSAQAARFNKKEEDAFYVAVKAYEDGFYDVSLTLFDRFLKTYMESDKRNDALVYIGQCYFFQEKYVKALDQLEPLLKKEGGDGVRGKVLYWLGEVYSKGRDYKQAADFYKELIRDYKDSPYFGPAYKSLALAQFNEANYAEALATYRAIIAQSQDAASTQDAFFGVCEILYRTKDYAQLKKELSDFIVRYPQSPMIPRAYFYLGEANFYLNQLEEAIAAYRYVETAASDEEQKSLAHLGMGWTYLKLKKFDEAKEIFSVFGEEDQPTSVWLGKAVLAAGLASYERALEFFDRVIAQDKKQEYTPFAYFGKAEVFYNLSRFQEALVAYRTSLDKLKMTSGVYTDSKELRDKIYYGLAWSYLKVGDFKSAQEAFQKVASLSTDKTVKWSALVQLADTYQDAAEYKKAIEAYQKFLEDYPDTVYNDYIQYQLGMTWLKMENLDSAVLAFRKLLKDYPTSQLIDDACYFLGMAYFRKGDFSSAKNELEKFSSDHKDSTYRLQSLFLLGESLSNLGEYKPAIEVFNSILKEGSGQEILRQKAEYEIANAYAALGDDTQANKRLSDFVARYPDSQLAPDVLYWLGQSYAQKKNSLSGHKYFERLIRNYPDHELTPDTYLENGLFYLDEGNADAALRNFELVKEKGKGSSLGRAWVLSGDIFLAKSDFQGALKNYEEAARLGGPTAQDAYIKIAEVYKRRKAPQEAKAALEKALAWEGGRGYSAIQFDIAELCEESGLVQEALEAYLKVYYLYPQDKVSSVKALLRVARIYEDKEDWVEFASILEKIASYDVPESKYARERLQSLKTEVSSK